MTLPEWPRAAGPALGEALLKSDPADFRVDETLSFSPSGDGPHTFLRIEKTGCNTQWVAGRLARHAGVPSRAVGYAGLKDRDAITSQWFSVPEAEGSGADWDSFRVEGLRILARTRNRRKLRRGAIAHNHFRVRLRSVIASRDAVGERLRRIASTGVPNYFGPQRFGRSGRNLALAAALFGGERLERQRRAFALSAGRAWLFNRVLAARVEAGNWDRVLPGEVLILDGRKSVFAAGNDIAVLAERCSRLEIHPTGPLWGRGGPRPDGEALALEARVVAGEDLFTHGLEREGLDMARRSLRLVPRAMTWALADGECRLSFRLPAGEYATTLMREVFELR